MLESPTLIACLHNMAMVGHEPDIGELNYAYLFKVIDDVSASCSWSDWVGCEYRPARGTQATSTSAGLGWLVSSGARAQASK